MSDMNLLHKIKNITTELNSKSMKKSGNNAFMKFKYFELSDIMPELITLLDKYGVLCSFYFDNTFAYMDLENCDKPEEKKQYKMHISYESKSNGKLEAHPMQAIGQVHTYARRYLLLSAFCICEHDGIDCVDYSNDQDKTKKTDSVEDAQIDFLNKKIKTIDDLNKLMANNSILEKLKPKALILLNNIKNNLENNVN